MELGFKNHRQNEAVPELDHKRIPHHVAIIMDGNGRWAQKRHLPRVAGHKRGMEVSLRFGKYQAIVQKISGRF